MNEISFTKVKLPFGWLGNMAPYPNIVDGHTWPTSEALFQALRFSDDQIRQDIRTQKSPMAAKMVAKRNREQMVVAPQSDQDLANMRRVLRLKVEQHPSLRVALLDTGDARIIEDCTARPRGSGLFWGAAKTPQGWWNGENWLGKLWEELREELRDVQAK